jgi:hypothetical protein
MFPVALLLLNSKSLSRRFDGSIRTVAGLPAEKSVLRWPQEIDLGKEA